MVVKVVFHSVPTMENAPMIRTAIRAATRLYSIAVTPSSLSINDFNQLNLETIMFYPSRD